MFLTPGRLRYIMETCNISLEEVKIVSIKTEPQWDSELHLKEESQSKTEIKTDQHRSLISKTSKSKLLKDNSECDSNIKCVGEVQELHLHVEFEAKNSKENARKKIYFKSNEKLVHGDIVLNMEVHIPNVKKKIALAIPSQADIVYYMEALEIDEGNDHAPGAPTSCSCSLKRKKSVANHMVEKNNLLKEALWRLTNKETNNKTDAGILAEIWAAFYTKLSPTRQIYAKKAIEEILVSGQLELLSLNTVNSNSSNTTAPSSGPSTPSPSYHSSLQASRSSTPIF
uniref:Uncharacterized protein n=1 Tax=Timema poppense TaxID=170557 RepID=A0A7R9DLN5_TIMPO|nr:unnamed protein product [Timema poppensis]